MKTIYRRIECASQKNYGKPGNYGKLTTQSSASHSIGLKINTINYSIEWLALDRARVLCVLANLLFHGWQPLNLDFDFEKTGPEILLTFLGANDK